MKQEGAERRIGWSISGSDSGGGAGLSADARAFDAFGVHLCPVVAVVTAQNSVAVTRIEPVGVHLLNAQLAVLHVDFFPDVVKTGLLGSAEQIELVAEWIDRLRLQRPVALVVDPVLSSSTGRCFADDAVLRAYIECLLPRATIVTPNRAEAAALLNASAGGAGALEPSESSAAGFKAQTRTEGQAEVGTRAPIRSRNQTQVDSTSGGVDDLPTLARSLRKLGAHAVCITGGDTIEPGGQVLDWLDSEHAEGWLASPRIATFHGHGSGCTFASSAAAALALGHVAADAVVLGKMAASHALKNGYRVGSGPGPVHALPGFAADPALLPKMSWGKRPEFYLDAEPARCAADRFDVDCESGDSAEAKTHGLHAAPAFAEPPATRWRPGVYAVVGDVERALEIVEAGVAALQLRIKVPGSVAGEIPGNPALAASWADSVQSDFERVAAACARAGTLFVVNDHFEIALELKRAGLRIGLHLGQQDLLAMGEAQRGVLLAAGIPLGISTHSLWELCRARTLRPAYIACGPVWPTTTKSMPWRPQGLQNLAWWCSMAGVPVAAIGGIIDRERAGLAARAGARWVCVARAVTSVHRQDVRRVVDDLRRACEEQGCGSTSKPGARSSSALAALPALPAPTLASEHGDHAAAASGG